MLKLPKTLMKGLLPIKLLVAVAWVLFAINIGMTISQRRHQQMYVSLWYVMGTLVWTTFTFIVGNFAVEWVPQAFLV